MGKQRALRRPRFWWQALLILLPIGVLAGVALISIRQDKSLALQEANERAHAIAEDLVSKVCSRLNLTNDATDFERRGLVIGGDGSMIFPPSCAPVPLAAPLDLDDLSQEQKRLWEKVETLGAGNADMDHLGESYRAFIAANPPDRFAAIAHYNLGLALMQQGSPKEASEAFSTALENSADFVTPGGLPLQPLCEIKLLEPGRLGPASEIKLSIGLDTICSNLVYRPTLLSPWLLTSLEASASFTQTTEIIRKYLAIWNDQERSRKLHDVAVTEAGADAWRGEQFRWVSVFPNAEHVQTLTNRTLPSQEHDIDENWLAIPQDKPPPIPLKTFETARYLKRGKMSLHERSWPEAKNYFPLSLASQPALALNQQQNTNAHWFLWRSESELGKALSDVVTGEKQIPGYFGVGLEVAGKLVRQSAPDLRAWESRHKSAKGGAGFQKEYLGEPATNILATASLPAMGINDFQIHVYLTGRSALLQRQQARTFWIGTLILFAAATSFLGLFMASRAFHRQQVLTELKTNFVSSVSHELRAPIASVRLLAESLEGGKIQESKKQHEYFRFIGQECRRLSALIENILDFSRIEQGRKQYEFQPTDLTALTRQTVAVMQTYAAEKEVALELDLSQLAPPEKLLEVNIDGRAIQQALVNLIDNAIKHSRRGQVVRVGLERPVFGVQCSVFSGEKTDEERCSKIMLWVEDNGPGIPVAEHERIFERFYRLGSELRRETQGVGIGLSLVKHIVEGHGGEVVVRSMPGEGSRFTIELPVASRGAH